MGGLRDNIVALMIGRAGPGTQQNSQALDTRPKAPHVEGKRIMKYTTCVATALIASGCTLGGLSAQQATGIESARSAFPVPPTVRVVRDLVYAQYGARQLKLDVYRPPQTDQRSAVPGIVVVRGGGWRSGDKDAFGFIAGQLAKEGFVAVSIEYRTSAEAKFPAAAHDVKAAVRWLRAHAAEYGVDPDAIGAIGGSAGAHLVALLGTSAGVDDLEGTGGTV